MINETENFEEMQQKKLRRNNLIVAAILFSISIAGVLFPFWFVPKLAMGG